MNSILIESQRFNLKILKKKHVTSVYLNWINSPDNKYIDFSNQKRSKDEIISYVEQRSKSKVALFFGIFLNDSGRHIGNIKYEPIDTSTKQATMGILIGDKNWRGKGVAVEVIKISSIWLHKNMGIEKILLGVNTDNTSAIKAYKKIGFKKIDTLHDCVKIQKMQLDIVSYFFKSMQNISD
jgi:RimJ/RimL family protein N-acetyltransferase